MRSVLVAVGGSSCFIASGVGPDRVTCRTWKGPGTAFLGQGRPQHATPLPLGRVGSRSTPRAAASLLAGRQRPRGSASTSWQQRKKEEERVHSRTSLAALAGSSSVVFAVLCETLRQIVNKPLSYATIPIVASLVGYGTNWVGVKMIFYPLKYKGLNLYRWKEQPLGLLGWQGIVPTKARKMGARLTDVVTRKLLSLKEAFARLDASRMAALMEPSVLEAIKRDSPDGEVRAALLRPFMHTALTNVVARMQSEIEEVLDLSEVVSSAFARDKLLLVELFQKVGRKELEFLVNSGLTFGFALGILQMFLWVMVPNGWVLPVGGALVGYITNWVAIKLIFEPIEPVQVGPFVLQGLFEKRQVEVSEEFAEFLAARVLTSPRLLQELCTGQRRQRFQALVRKAVPPVVPNSVIEAAIKGIRRISEQSDHPLHEYVNTELGLQATLTTRLQALPAAEFEDLLHPVFQEDELTLIIAGGVLGFLAGVAQQAGSWGGPAGSGSIAVALSSAAARTASTGGTTTAAKSMLAVALFPRGAWLARSLFLRAGAGVAALFRRTLRLTPRLSRQY